MNIKDYTKNPSLVKNKAANQEFTFSFSGYNWETCKRLLDDKKCNVAVVFQKEKPVTYLGYPVLDGDISDMRLAEYDGLGNIIGLRLKGNHKNVKNFVVKL